MKRLRSKEAKTKAKELMKAIEMRREAEKKETQLKGFFKRIMENEHVAMVGQWIITIDEKVRTNLDRKALEEKMGEKIHDFEMKTPYVVLLIRRL